MSFETLRRSTPGAVGSTIEHLSSVSSTNDYLWNLARKEPGHLIAADVQTAGRGRGGNRWDATAGQNLLFSFYLEMRTGDPLLPLLPITTAVCVCEAVDPDGLHAVKTKWPNDIMHNEKKLCGILIESRVQSTSAQVVVGIGLNVNQTEFDPGVQATSLALIATHPFDRSVVLGRMLDALNRGMGELDPVEVVESYRGRCETIGRSVRFEHAGQTRFGRAVAVDESGHLLIEEAGEVRVYSGSEVTHLRPDH